MRKKIIIAFCAAVPVAILAAHLRSRRKNTQCSNGKGRAFTENPPGT